MADLKERLLEAQDNYKAALREWETIPQVFGGDDDTREYMIKMYGDALAAAIDRFLAFRNAENELWKVNREVAEVAKLAGFVIGRPLDHDDFPQEAELQEAA